MKRWLQGPHRTLGWVLASAGLFLVLAGMGHLLGVSARLAEEAEPRPRREVVFLVWVGLPQVLGGLLHLAAARGVARGEPYARRLSAAGAAVVASYAVPILPVVFEKPHLLGWGPVAHLLIQGVLVSLLVRAGLSRRPPAAPERDSTL
jgi:hypothetical protein